jgi:hypothetical protein
MLLAGEAEALGVLAPELNILLSLLSRKLPDLSKLALG